MQGERLVASRELLADPVDHLGGTPRDLIHEIIEHTGQAGSTGIMT